VCDWAKVIKSGLAAGLVMLIASFMLMPFWNAAFPAIGKEYLSGLYRPWSDPLMMAFFLHPFILGLALAYAYEIFSGAIKAKGAVNKGLRFGFIVWVISSIPGMYASYTSFYISLPMILSWTLNGLVQLLLGGIVIAKIWEPKGRK
jgi:hypothetical protein